jgi:uncharacterized membrane protein YeaQ/YmgE (transglycosylase-associated protein family)
MQDCAEWPAWIDPIRQPRNAGQRNGTIMLNIIGAIISGLIVGALARWFYPGHVSMGWIMTILLGIGGSLLAGLITSRGGREFSRAGCLASILGAMALIFIGRLIAAG